MTGISAAVTTGIYCLPTCSARPKPENVRAFPLGAAAEAAGYRACLRCRPYRVSPVLHWSTGPEMVCRAVHMIVDGALDGRAEGDLAALLGVSARHLRRLFIAHVGATPDQLARSCRAHFARRLLDDTDLPVAEIAFAAGFGSVRQLNRACGEIFKAPPGELRARRRRADRLVADGGLRLRLSFSGPLDWPAMLVAFREHAIPGVECVTERAYRRTVVVDGAPGMLEIAPATADHLLLTAHLPRWQDLIHIVQRARRTFALDVPADDAAEHLARDPIVGTLIAGQPGVRPPGAWDPYEVGVRAVIGQQLSARRAAAITRRLVDVFGETVPGLAAVGLDRIFPKPSVLARADLTAIGLSSAGASCVSSFARAVASGDLVLDRSAPLERLIDSMTALPGLRTTTAHYIALRLGERDAFPITEAALRRAIERLGGARGVTGPSAAAAWSPWRATAAAYLWSAHRRRPSTVR